MATEEVADYEQMSEKALSVDATDIHNQSSTKSYEVPSKISEEEEVKQTDKIEMTSMDPDDDDNKETKEETKEQTEIKKQLQYNTSKLLSDNSVWNTDQAREFHITGSFKTHWQKYVSQPSLTAKVKTHEGKEEVLHFAHPLAPRRVYVALKIKRISDVDNVRETYRCRFHMYFDWLLTQDGYESYVKYTVKNLINPSRIRKIIYDMII